ncbi:MAG: hypothetical protein PHN75_15880, partial [Syntrophales bacterium]|nr:hypothetical protein [Syntrophales bacterium]
WYRYFDPLYVGNSLLESDVGEEIDAVKLLLPEVLQEIMKEEEHRGSRGMEELRRAIEGHPRGLEEMSRSARRVYERASKAARERYIINTMTGTFDRFVENGIFRFKKDFGFEDPREGFSIIGQSRPKIIFFTEKEGLWWLCKDLAKRHEITVVASQGESSLLAMEFLVEKLKKRRMKSVIVVALTDYDPWGFLIAENFAKKLEYDVFFGKDNVELVRLNGSQDDLKKLFTDEQIEKGKRDLTMYSQYKQSQVSKWMDKTDGIGGKPFGIHVDLAHPDRLKAVVDAWIESVGNEGRE